MVNGQKVTGQKVTNLLGQKITTYITNLVCYTYFHWFLNPECQHIFGKQTGYIFQSQKTTKITLH